MSYRNSSWYSDPTAGLAMGNVRREEKRKRRQRNGRKPERPVRSHHPAGGKGLQNGREKVREEVYRTVCRLSDPLSQRTIICHYLQGLSWRSTAEKMRYCLTQIYRFRDAGYEELEKMPDAAVTDRVK